MLDEKDWNDFKQRFKTKSGIDLNLYKANQMQRRIGNLMTRYGAKSFVQLFQMIEKDKKLFSDFVEYLTINVTEFFRNPDKFTELETKVLPELLKKSPRLNIWSAGCSTGAEPYSLAILLQEKTPATRHRILATDLDVEILAKAKQGIYTDNDLKNLSPTRLKNSFTGSDGRYAIANKIKDCVEFRQHNLLLDRFENSFDLILCRNVVIYFTEEAKDQLYRRFFAALKPGGILFVGGTEAILNFRDMGFTGFLPFFYQKP